ncbi:MAG TPA: hypothetical protein PKM25_06530 [Candidatus Ozemobacteraceae bacterium]|nr:hypothetical protein [Candidatus Ozemobacteraceae bacterium]
MALPLVMLFVTVTFITLFWMSTSRTGVRKQTLSGHSQKRAYYAALGGVQHALLKLRLLHREAYDAGSLVRGVCPFFNPYGNSLVETSSSLSNKTTNAMNIFISDLSTASCRIPSSITSGEFPLPDSDKWGYSIASFAVYSYHTSTSTTDFGTIREIVRIDSVGSAFDPRDKESVRKENVTKQVELLRSLH